MQGILRPCENCDELVLCMGRAERRRCGLFMFFACFGGCIKLITLIPVPKNIALQILYCFGVLLLGFASVFISVGLTFLAALPFSKMAGKYTMPEMKRKIFSEACSHLRAYYGLQEPYILTKCFDSSDQNFVNHDVCIFVAGGELRITADLKNGFLYGERDLGCYAFGAEEISLFKKQEAGGICRPHFIQQYYFLPVEPNPPSPRTVSESPETSSYSTLRYGAITSCAIRSPAATVCAVFP